MTYEVCDECSTRTREPMTTTISRRRLCPECSARLSGAITGSLAGGGDVGQAVAISGWHQRLRKWRKRA